MKNSMKLLPVGISMFFTCSVFAQVDMRYNKPAVSTKSDKMIQQKKTGTKYQADSLQMDKNKSKTDQKNNVSPITQPKKTGSSSTPSLTVQPASPESASRWQISEAYK